VDDIRPSDPPDEGAEPSLGGGATPDVNESVPKPSDYDLTKRLADLERELAKTRAERDEYKASTYSLLGELIPFEPVTDEEAHEMIHGPKGQPIREIIEELERGLRADG